MKKRIAMAGALAGMMGIVAYVAISQVNPLKTEMVRNTSDSSGAVSFASLLPASTIPEFYYGVGPRFIATITKEDLSKATSVVDILPPEAGWGSYKILNVTVKQLDNDLELGGTGLGLTLSDAQRELLRSFDYSDSFRLIADRDHPGELAYFVTIVSEQEAAYVGGNEALVDYLRRNSASDVLQVRDEQLKAGKIMFTVNTEGGVSNVKLSSSSGYAGVDQTMMELVRKTAGNWIPAMNAEGTKVSQQLVFSFGRAGC